MHIFSNHHYLQFIQLTQSFQWSPKLFIFHYCTNISYVDAAIEVVLDCILKDSNNIAEEIGSICWRGAIKRSTKFELIYENKSKLMKVDSSLF